MSGQHPTDELIRKLIQTRQPATEEEIERIIQRIATAPLDRSRVRAPGYLRGQSYGGG